MNTLLYFITALIMASAGYSQTTNEYLNSGKAKSDLKDFTGAIADYTKAIESNPKEADAYVYRGYS